MAGLPLALALTLADAAASQLLRPRLEIAPYAGALLVGEVGRLELEDGAIVGARAGVRLPGGLAVEGQLGYAPLGAGPAGSEQLDELDVDVMLLEAGLLYALPLPGPLTPFLGVAAGRATFDPELENGPGGLDSESSTVLSGGVGARLSLGGINLRVDLRDHVVLDALEETRAVLERNGDGGTLQAIEASVGISFLF